MLFSFHVPFSSDVQALLFSVLMQSMHDIIPINYILFLISSFCIPFNLVTETFTWAFHFTCYRLHPPASTFLWSGYASVFKYNVKVIGIPLLTRLLNGWPTARLTGFWRMMDKCCFHFSFVWQTTFSLTRSLIFSTFILLWIFSHQHNQR